MGSHRSGRKPQPTALKVLRGNPGKRRLNENEPKHVPLEEACPDELTNPVARAEWQRIAPHLIRVGQVTAVDRSTLMGYCQKYGAWLVQELKAQQDPSYQAVNVANRCFVLMLRAAVELGITPSSRSRVTVAPVQQPTSKWAGVIA